MTTITGNQVKSTLTLLAMAVIVFGVLATLAVSAPDVGAICAASYSC